MLLFLSHHQDIAHLDPVIDHDFTARGPQIGVFLQHQFEQVPDLLRDMRGDNKLRRSCLLIQIIVIFAPEGKTTAEESEQQHTRCINVGRWPAVFCLANDFGSHV